MTTPTLREQYKWKKVQAPKTWNPRRYGEELVGYYGGKTTRVGPFGSYEVVIVHVPIDGPYLVSGTQVVQAADAALLTHGSPVRLIFRGRKDISGGRTMKQIEMYVPTGESIPVDELPELQV